MQPPKRQIIKTRSQRPYIVARIILVLLAVIAVIVIALAYSGRHHVLGAGGTLLQTNAAVRINGGAS